MYDLHVLGQICSTAIDDHYIYSISHLVWDLSSPKNEIPTYSIQNICYLSLTGGLCSMSMSCLGGVVFKQSVFVSPLCRHVYVLQ